VDAGGIPRGVGGGGAGHTAAWLLDQDGSAFIVHSSPDNYANIPTRYAPNGPDQATRSTGDAGTRQACGVVRRR